MVLDPLAAVSLAGTIVTFIDCGTKVVSEAVDIYQSATGASSSTQDIQLVVVDLMSISEQLKKSLVPDGVITVLNEHERRLEDLRSGSEKTAGMLLEKLEPLMIMGQKSKRKALGKALRSVWNKQEIGEIQDSLTKLRDELQFRVLIDVKKTVDLVFVKQSEQFEHLDQTAQSIVNAMLQNHTDITTILNLREERVQELQSEIKIHVTEENFKTRHIIATSLQDVKKDIARAQQAIFSQNVSEHLNTRDNLRYLTEQQAVLKREIEEDKAMLKSILERFIRSFESSSDEGRKKTQERTNAAITSVAAKSLILDDVEKSLEELEEGYDAVVMAPSPTTQWKVTPYPASVLTAPQRISNRPKSTAMSSDPIRPQSSNTSLTPLATLQTRRPRSVSDVDAVLTLSPLMPYTPWYVFVRVGDNRPLVELDVRNLNDRDFFFMLREASKRATFKGSLSVVSGFYYQVTKVEFAQFYLDDLHHVRVLGTGAGATPPPEADPNWEYFPRPMDVVPPVGSEAMLDYVRSPAKAATRADNLLKRIPKCRGPVREILSTGEGVLWGLDVEYSFLGTFSIPG